MLSLDAPRRRPLACAATMSLALFAAPARGQIPFEAQMQAHLAAPGQPGVVLGRTIRTDRIADLLGRFQQASLAATLPGYTRQTPLTADLRVRGVPARLSFPEAGSRLRLEVPGLGLDRSFTGRSRDQSLALLVNGLAGEGGLLNGPLLRLGVQETAIDPIAGNPNSLMAGMLGAAFQTATGIGLGAPLAGPGGAAGLVGGVGGAQGVTQGALRLPAGWRLPLPQGDALLVDGVFHATRIDGRWESHGGSVGLGYAWRAPVAPAGGAWTLTPAARFGVAGSQDLGAGSGMVAFSLTGTLRLPAPWAAPGASLTVGSTAGYLATSPVGRGDLALDYGLRNWGFRNGVALAVPAGEAWGRPLAMTFHAVDTRFAGSALYVNAWQEFGVSATLGGRVPLTVGVQALVGQGGYGGVTAGIGLRF
jgi:hypothetical protein